MAEQDNPRLTRSGNMKINEVFKTQDKSQDKSQEKVQEKSKEKKKKGTSPKGTQQNIEITIDSPKESTEVYEKALQGESFTNKQFDRTLEDTYNVPEPQNHMFSFSRSNAANNTVSEGDIVNRTLPTDSFYEDITKALFKDSDKTEENFPKLREEVPIHNMRSDEILQCSFSPFSQESELPDFEHGSAALQYFQILRTTLSKIVRSTLQHSQLKESMARKQIPRGLKITKRLTAVDPSPDLRFNHLGIIAEAETKIMEITMEHYEENIPKLHSQFDHYYSKTTQLPPVDRRLLVLKLIHFKNTLTEDRARAAEEKLERPDNRYMEPGTSGNVPIASTNPNFMNVPTQQKPPSQTSWGAPNGQESWGLTPQSRGYQPQPQRPQRGGRRGRTRGQGYRNQ